MPENNKEKPAVPKVTTGKVTVGKKKGLIRTFLEDDAKDVGETLIDDIVRPTIKNLIFDVCESALDSLLFGRDDGGSHRRRRYSGGTTNYSSYYRAKPYTSSDDRSRRAGSPRSRFDIREIQFDNRADADAVLDILCEELERYEQVSVGDFYSACDLSPNGGDFNYGWFDLRNARVEPKRNYWIINLPKPVEFD